MKPSIVVVTILCSHAVCIYFLFYKVTATLAYAQGFVKRACCGVVPFAEGMVLNFL